MSAFIAASVLQIQSQNDPERAVPGGAGQLPRNLPVIQSRIRSCSHTTLTPPWICTDGRGYSTTAGFHLFHWGPWQDFHRFPWIQNSVGCWRWSQYGMTHRGVISPNPCLGIRNIPGGRFLAAEPRQSRQSLPRAPSGSRSRPAFPPSRARQFRMQQCSRNSRSPVGAAVCLASMCSVWGREGGPVVRCL